jgi:glycosyltransferase involved in cell wall biosynthesis
MYFQPIPKPFSLPQQELFPVGTSGDALAIAVIVPCFKVRRHLAGVLERIPSYVSRVYVVDDACPEETGRHAEETCGDPRLRVITREVNGGVGAAVCSGYAAALADGMDICVKIDGDGQMDPAMIAVLLAPILSGHADYSKGNRFFDVEHVRAMPGERIAGNLGLSFFTKLSSGYWDVFDPTNGFTAIHARVLERLPLEKIHSRFFFESDMLFRLGCMSARVVDVPMTSRYGDETSNLRLSRALMTFSIRNSINALKRIGYSYFLRDFSIASIYLILSVLLSALGASLGIFFWSRGISLQEPATPGQVMFAALPLVFGLQLGLSFLGHDMMRTPRSAVHPYLSRLKIGRR